MKITKLACLKVWSLAAVLGTAAVGSSAADLNQTRPIFYAAITDAGLNDAAVLIQAQEQYDKVFNVCMNMVPVDHPDFALANEIASEQDTLLGAPKHGKLVLLPKGVYLYYPETGFLGVDQMTFLVSYRNSVSGKQIREKVIYSVHVGRMAPEYGPCKDNNMPTSNPTI